MIRTSALLHGLCIFVFGVCLLVPASFDSIHFTDSDGSEFEPRSQLTHSHSTHDKDEADIPIILYWSYSLFPHFNGKSDKYRITCGDASCYVTDKRKYAKHPKTRGFWFYGSDIEPDDLPLPRLPHHEWAIFHEESPLNKFMLCHKPFIELFNHTCTFRNESDYPLTTQAIDHRDFLTERKPVPLATKNRKRRQEKFAPVVYVQTHCEVPSDRDRYVKELMKYIAVDSYGKCLHNRNLPQHLVDPADNFQKDEFYDLISQYKFHLAFENANCEDYMTEKLYRPLHLGSVPIYKGSPRARDWMPNNHSVIMVDDFSTPEELAKFIRKIDEDDEQYETYLEFKKTGITNKFLSKHLDERPWHLNEQNGFGYFLGFECQVCQKINDRLKVERAHRADPSLPLPSPKMATTSHLGCPQPYTSIGDPEDLPKNDTFLMSDWIGQYWDEFDQAIAVRNMLLAKEENPRKFQAYYRKVYEKNLKSKP